MTIKILEKKRILEKNSKKMTVKKIYIKQEKTIKKEAKI